MGDGSNIDPWIPTIPLHKPFRPRQNLTAIKHVVYLIDESSKTWKEKTIRYIFSEHIVNEILKSKISASHHEDSIKWMGERIGVLTTKSAYNFFQFQKCAHGKISKEMGTPYGLA